jgi:hypothetical protein
MNNYVITVFGSVDARTEKEALSKINKALGPKYDFELESIEDITHVGCFHYPNCDEAYCGDKR